MSRVAKRYANALFLMCESQKEKDDLYAELEVFRNWFFGSTELRNLIQNPLIPNDVSKDVITALLDKANASKQLVNTLKYIIDRGRLSHLDEIMSSFRELYQDSNNIKEAKVTTAMPLDDEDKSYFQSYLEERFKYKLQMTYVVDPDLIGGFKVIVGSKLIDSSLKSKLFNLRRTLKGAA